MEKQIEQVMQLIDELGRPVTPEEWVDFLVSIRDECTSRIDAARHDIGR